MLSTKDAYATRRKVTPRHHYILLLTSACDGLTKQVEMFANDIDEALEHSGRSRLFSKVEIWEDGTNRGSRAIR